MKGKVLILSSKTVNARVVLSRLVYGADVRRPEQRGLLSVREDDILFIYDIDRRLLIGPFRAAGEVLYNTEPL